MDGILQEQVFDLRSGDSAAVGDSRSVTEEVYKCAALLFGDRLIVLIANTLHSLLEINLRDRTEINVLEVS